jgi:hypothetical protein
MTAPRVKDVIAWVQDLCGQDRNARHRAAERLDELPEGWFEDHSLPRTRVGPVVGRLAEVLAMDESPLVQEWCAAILAEVPSDAPVVVAALRRALGRASDAVAATIVYALGSLGASAASAVPELAAAAAHPSAEVRWRVAWALDYMKATGPEVAEAVRPLLTDERGTARGYAASAYARAVEYRTECLQALTPLLADPDPFPRAEAAKALART